MQQKVIKVGNSLGVTIPASFVKISGIISGSKVKVRVFPEKGKIIYSFSGIRQLSLGKLFQK